MIAHGTATPMQIEWTIPGNGHRETKYVVADGLPGQWKFASRYAFEPKWYDEPATPELVESANRAYRARCR